MDDTACPICEAPGMAGFFRMTDVPVADNVLWSDREEALRCPKGDIHLSFCSHCGCIANLDDQPNNVPYGIEYENSLHFSQNFQSYARQLVADLVERYRLRNKTIIDIGCGKGEFLEMLCEEGENRGIGVDPSYSNGRGNCAAGLGITYLKDWYSDSGCHPCDFICCRHVLEHIQRPKVFLDAVRRTAEQSGAPVFFEVPNARYTLQHDGIWDLIYPHRFYFVAESLERLFACCGFAVAALQQSFGGQYLTVEASPGNGSTMQFPAAAGENMSVWDDVLAFKQRYETRVNELARALGQLRRSAKRAVVWGAGSKGVSFLNKFKGAAPVKYIVDVNPHKQGKFVPGTGQQVVPPQFLRELQPACIIIMNPIYREEIERQTEELGIRPEFLQA